MVTMLRLSLLLLLFSAVSGFMFGPSKPLRTTRLHSMATQLTDPTQRDAQYGGNVAQYLADLHDNKATFNFCGGMMFQLVLTEKLREHLLQVATSNNDEQQPVIYDASKRRMSQIPDYEKSPSADNVHLFHGREIRQVEDAAGGMGMVLQLSMANANDPEGWTPQEVEGYDGWAHDVGRVWRNGARLQDEGFTDFQKRFGPTAYTLNHRFYLHMDQGNRLWLSAEDGCEGTPAATNNPLSNLLGALGL